MKSDPTASSSDPAGAARPRSSPDIEAARELSRRLSVAPRPASPPGPAAPAYVRFGLAAPVERAGPAAAPVVPSRPEQPPAAAPEEAATWDEFLERTLRAVGAASAFLMDEQGLLVASRGPIPASDVEGIGARLMAALEHARKMQIEEGRDPAVVVELGASWLTGFAVPLRTGATLTMGVLGKSALHADERTRLSEALGRWRAAREVSSTEQGS